ncbi:MAG TPA: hypothetical protein VK724_15935 [Bryobacteraceae bacterium]|jgi:hypothetical protein|nr:hypothetical protein [Bryobacteraceae bacterium]
MKEYGMNYWLASMLLGMVATSSSAFAQPGQKIGEVLSTHGQWCRQASVLKTGDAVFLEDDIRYCSSPLTTTDQIVIRFYANQDSKAPANKPYDRPYNCTTPGICDKKEKLFLEGAYIRLRYLPSGTPLISSPPRASLLLDTIIEQGKSWVPDAQTGSRGFGGFGTGKAVGDFATSSFQICSFTNDKGDKVDKCSSEPGAAAKLPPGLYGVFRKDDHASPASLIVIVPPGSNAEAKWSEVPEAFKTDQSKGTMAERRLYLVELFKNENK